MLSSAVIIRGAGARWAAVWQPSLPRRLQEQHGKAHLLV